MNQNKFKFRIIKNNFHQKLILKDFKKITNTSLIIIWKNKKTRKLKYLIQKRSKVMRNGKNKLAIGGGMLEKSDESLQFGAIREIMEESQIQFKNKKNLDITTIRELEPFLFPLGKFKNNFTFYMIIESIYQPKILGPVTNNNTKPFLNSVREIDIENNSWNDIKKIINGHSFLSKTEITKHYIIEPKIWKYSKIALEKIFQIFE